MNTVSKQNSILLGLILPIIAMPFWKPGTAFAEECPREMFARPGGFPATDYRVTVDSIDFPELHQGERSSIAFTSNATYLVAWQSVNADQSLDNDIYVLRERDHSGGDPQNSTDCPLPLTLADDGAFHSGASAAVGLRVPVDPPNFHFMVGWTSQMISPSQAPSLRKLDALNFLLFPEDLSPGGHPFSVGGFADLPISPAGGNLFAGRLARAIIGLTGVV